MHGKTFVFLAVIAVAIILCGAASAATVKTSNINNAKINNVGSTDQNQHGPAADGSRVVWIQTDSTGKSTIYYKNLAIGTKIKVKESSQSIANLDISGTRVVWEQNVGAHSCIYVKNVATGAYGKVQNSNTYQKDPAISANRIVWQQGGAVYVKNIFTGAYGKVRPSTQFQGSPDIDGKRIVWVQNSFVYVINVATKKYGKVALAGDQVEPKILGTKVLWWTHSVNGGSSGCPHFDTSAYLTNLATGKSTKVLHSSEWDNEFGLTATRIVWLEESVYGDPYTPYVEHYVCTKNLKTGTVSRVYNTSNEQYNPAISNSVILWDQLLSGKEIIYYKNLANGHIGPLSP